MKNLKEGTKVRTALYSTILLFAVTSCWRDQQHVAGSDPLALERHMSDVHKALSDTACTYAKALSTLQPIEAQLCKAREIDDFKFKASYQPHLLLALSNGGLIDSGTVKNNVLMDQINTYASLHYIKFSIKKEDFHSELLRYDVKDAQEYSNRVMYYSFYSKAQAYVIENGKDTIKCGFVTFERTFDVSPELNLTFVFERKSRVPVEDLSFVFEDVIFNKGRIHFEFDYKNLSRLNSTEINKLLL